MISLCCYLGLATVGENNTGCFSFVMISLTKQNIPIYVYFEH